MDTLALTRARKQFSDPGGFNPKEPSLTKNLQGRITEINVI